MMSKVLRVLLIEDIEDDAVLLLREVRRLGYTVISDRQATAAGVRQALDSCEWDVILSDYAMHNFTAVDALAIIQEKKIDLPFIIVSARIGEETAVEAMRAGAHDFLIKRNLTRLGPVLERELREATSRSHRKQTEEALRQSEDRFARAFAASPIPTVMFQLASGKVLDVNKRFCEFSGYVAQEVINQDISAYGMWIKPQDSVQILKKIQSQQSIQDYETSFFTHSKQLSFVLLSAEPIEVGGQPCVLVMFYDITERKLAENRLRHLQSITAALSEALTPDRVAEVIIQNVPRALEAAAALVVSVVEESGKLSLDIIRATGYEPALLRSWASLNVQQCSTPLTAAIVQRFPEFVNLTTEAEASQKGDMRLHNEVFESAAAVPMLVEGRVIGAIMVSFRQAQVFDGETMQFIAALGDQCGQAMQRAQLYTYEQRARLAAEEANQVKVQFLAMISHELRTPLASIKGYSSTLMAKDVSWSSERQEEFISTINEETDKLTDLVNQLLDMSRLQAGQMSIDPQELELMDILDYTMQEIDTLTANHTLKLEIPPGIPPIYADERRIGQVITNLIENASRYSIGATQITLSAVHEDDCVRVDVADQGVGISPQDIARVFEPFQQINRKQELRQGTGLGLTICKGLVEAHGGRIWINSQEGVGTTVSFTVPVASLQNQRRFINNLKAT